MKKIIPLLLLYVCAAGGGVLVGDILSERKQGGDKSQPVLRHLAHSVSKLVGNTQAVANVKSITAGTNSEPTPTTVEGLRDWAWRSPIEALAWYSAHGWNSLGDNPAEIKERLVELSAIAKEGRTEESYGERLAWVNNPAQQFAMAKQWGQSNGTQVAEQIANSSNGADLMWSVAICNPAHSWVDTATWVADLKVDEAERSAVVDQMARKSIASGEGESAVVAFSGHAETVYDQAKGSLVVDLIGKNSRMAEIAWGSITSSDAKLAAAVRVLADPSTDAATKQLMARWAQESGIDIRAGAAWKTLATSR